MHGAARVNASSALWISKFNLKLAEAYLGLYQVLMMDCFF